MWKGFSTRDAAGKDTARKQIYGGTFYNHHYPGTLRRHLQRYPSVHESRLSSSWVKGDGSCVRPTQPAESKNRTEKKSEDDWYTRWHKREENRYNDLVKRIEADPFGTLFGRSKWVNWIENSVQEGTKFAEASITSAAGVKVQSPQPKSDKTWSRGNESSRSRQGPAASNSSEASQLKEESISTESHMCEYEFDPISMRKVPKRVPSPAHKVEAHSQNQQESCETPVKPWKDFVAIRQDIKFCVTPTPATTVSTRSNPQPSSSWLAQEGFGTKQEHQSDHRKIAETTGARSTSATEKLESALDRHLQEKNSSPKEREQPVLQYKPKENTTDDVDLLRSSDVRASAGLRGRVARESGQEKMARQQKLEKQFDAIPIDREQRLAQELSSEFKTQITDPQHLEQVNESRASQQTTQGQAASDGSPEVWVNEISDVEIVAVNAQKGPNSHSTSDIPIVEATKTIGTGKTAPANAKVDKLRAQIVPLKARLDAMKSDYDALRQRWLVERRRKEQAQKMEAMHEDEVEAQKSTMTAIETRNSERVLCRKPSVARGEQEHKEISRPTLQSLLPGEGDLSSNVHEFAKRDRWYKRKALHAQDEMDVKLQQIARDKHLVEEIRGIYEKTYGTIDTDHRQQARDDGATGSAVDKGITLNPSDMSLTSDGGSLPEKKSLTPSTPQQETVGDQDPLAIVQKLFSELRQAQTLLKEYRALHTSEAAQTSTDTEVLHKSIIKTQEVYRPVVMQIAKQAIKLGNMSGLSGVIAAAAAVADSPQHSSARYPPSVALKANHTSAVNKATPCVYQILAYDSATGKVTSAKATSLAPFSREQQLLPVEALEVLNNPGKFLPHLMTLHNKGYSVVSGTNNILVFKKEATGDELAAAKHAEAVKHPNPIDGTVAQTGNFASPTGFVNHDSPIPLEELEARAADQEIDSQTPDNKTASAPRVRREEDVFSGGRRSNWQDKYGRHKHRHGRRRKSMLGRMLLTGTVTAACCYGIGLISEMVR